MLDSTEFSRITALPDGIDLDSVKKIGSFTIYNPIGLPAGPYFLSSYEANIGGNRRAFQALFSPTTGLQRTRYRSDAGWTSWAVAGSGGGYSAAGDVTYTNSSDSFGYVGGISVEDALDSLAPLYNNIPRSPSTIFNVLDYGAVPNDSGAPSQAANRAAFEAAIVAATAVGGGVIYAPRGTYYLNYGGSASVGGVRLRNNCHLVGDGMGLTTITVGDIGNNDLAGVVRTQSGIENVNIVVRDLTIDGNKGGQTGWANIICFYAGVTPDDRIHMDRDIFCINVECKNGKNGTAGSSNLSRGYGFDPHEVVDRFVAINCYAHDNERDGFVLDGVINFQLQSCRSNSNGRYGYNFITQTFNGAVVGCHASNNAANNYMVQGDSSRIALIGCHSYNSGEQGIRIRRGLTVLDTHCSIIGCHVEGSNRNGINITGANYNIVSNNVILNSSQSLDNTYQSVALDEDDGDSGTTTGSAYNLIQANYAIETGGTNRAKSAYREDNLAVNPPQYNRYVWNSARGHRSTKYLNLLPTAEVVDNFRGFVYDVRDYGAVGNGTTDDRPSIQAAIDAAAAAGGGTVYVPPGTYLLTRAGASSQGCIRVPSSISLIGAGIGNTTLLSGDAGATDITGVVRTVSGGTNFGITIENLTINAASADQTGAGSVTCLYIGGAFDENVNIRNVLFFDAYSGTSLAGYGVRINSTYPNAKSITFEACEARSCDRDGFSIEGASSVVLSNCTASSNGRHGVRFSTGSRYCTVVGGRFESNVTNGILIEDDSSDIDVSRALIHGNESGLRIRPGASVTSTRIKIINSTFTANYRHGVFITGASENIVDGNHFFDNSVFSSGDYAHIKYDTDATYTGAVSSKNTIIGNRFANLTYATKYNIDETASANDNYYSGNTDDGLALLAPENITGALSRIHRRGRIHLEYAHDADPPQSTITALAKARSGHIVNQAFRDPLGRVREVGAPFYDRLVSVLTASNGGSTAFSVLGQNSPTLVGATGRTPSTVNKITATRRIGFVTAATANSNASVLMNSNNFVTRGANGFGGFNFFMKAALVTKSPASRLFFGLVFGITAVAINGATEPSGYAGDLLGVGFDSTDTNFQVFHNDNVGTATKIDLGASFPADNDTLLEIRFECAPSASTVYYYVRDLITGAVASGVITTDLPRNTQYYAPQASMTNNTDAQAVEFALSQWYLEHDPNDDTL